MSEKEEASRLAVPCDMTAHVLHKLLPAHSLVHVGMLRDSNRMDGWLEWRVPHALHIEAPRPETPRLNAEAANTPSSGGLPKSSAWLASAAGKRTLHTASGVVAGEGLLPAAAIAAIAPHAQVHEWPDQAVVTLDQLLAQNEKLAPNWLVLNTLAAAEVLAGAAEALRTADVVWTRTMLTQLPGWPEEAHLDSVAAFLRVRGFALVAMDEGMHPALGVAVFVKTSADIKYRTAGGSLAEGVGPHVQPYTHIVDDREDGQPLLQARLQALLLENSTLQHRQQFLQEELIKAQAQIELIKDLLLREGGI